MESVLCASASTLDMHTVPLPSLAREGSDLSQFFIFQKSLPVLFERQRSSICQLPPQMHTELEPSQAEARDPHVCLLFIPGATFSTVL